MRFPIDQEIEAKKQIKKTKKNFSRIERTGRRMEDKNGSK